MKRKIYKIIDTDDVPRLSKAYQWTMMIIIVISIVPLFFKWTCTLFGWIDRVTVAIYIADYIVRWLTADLKFPEYGKSAFLKYPFTMFAIFDMLSILPALYLLSPTFKLFRMFRLAQALRVLRFLRFSRNFDIISKVIRSEGRELAAVFYMSAGYILVSSLMVFSAEPETFDSFFDALYWSMVTLTTVGYGDIYPVTYLGRVIAMISAFMGVLVIALPTGIITAGYMNEIKERDDDRE